MQIKLSDHFTYSKLLRFTLPSIVMMVVSSIYSVVDGLFVSIVAISRQTGEIVSGPEILSRGFVYMKEAENLLDEAKAIVRETVEDSLLEDRFSDSANMKNRIRKALNTYLYTRTKRSPMILPVILEI